MKTTNPPAPMTSKLTCYKITRDDGSSYVTSMAAGVTLEQARAYFVGQVQIEEDPTTGRETLTRVLSVERA